MKPAPEVPPVVRASRGSPFHRRVLLEAWRLVWQRRLLWVFGFFGGLVLSGAVIEPAFTELSRMTRLGAWWMRVRAEGGIATGVPGGEIISRACRVAPAIAGIGFTAGAIIAVLTIAFCFIALGAVVAGLSAPHPLAVGQALRRGWRHAWAMFIIGLLNRAFQLVLLLLIALPVLSYALGVGGWTVAFATGLSILLFLPLAVGGNVVALYASIHAARRGASVTESLEAGTRLFFARWLESLETGAVLLAVSILAMLGFAMAVTLAVLPLWLFFAAMPSSGWYGGMGLIGAVGILAFCAAALVFWSMLSMFRLAVWLRFYERALHPVHGPRIVARLKRWFHPAHVG